MSEIKLIRAPGSYNTGSQRDYSYYRETIIQEIIPIINVLDLVSFPPRKGAVGYDNATGDFHYANGVVWLPVGTSMPVTLTTAAAESLIAAASAYPNFVLRGLVAGTDIGLAVTGNDITINYTGANVTLDMNAFAAGVDIVSDGVGPALQLRGIAGGANISTTANATDVVIAFTGTTGDDVTLALQGGAVGENIVSDGSGPSLAVKGISGGSNISVTSNATDLAIAFTGTTGDDVTLASAGGSATLVVDGTGPALVIKGLSSTNEVRLVPTATDISARLSYAYRETLVNTALVEADNHLGVKTSAGAITVTLPLIASLSFFQKQFVITDIDGMAPSNKITIVPSGGDTIAVPGGAPIVVNSKYASLSLYSTSNAQWCLM